MNLVAVGVNHTTADVELRERLAFSTQQAEAALHDERVASEHAASRGGVVGSGRGVVGSGA